jgi:hypothetical protein
LLSLATHYLHQPRATYRSVVRHERQLIGYPVTRPEVAEEAEMVHEVAVPPDVPSVPEMALDVSDSEEDSYHQAVIPPSLPWRFIGWLGCLTMVLAKAREMILQRHPNSLCHRVSGSVDPFKARSDARKVTLETARQLLLILPEWEACFGRPFFPQFATRAGFD